MGLFDKLKAVKNAITGGAAKVHVTAGPVKRGEPTTITVTAQSTGGEVKYSRVYLYIEGREELEVPDTDVYYDEDGDSRRRTETVRASATSYEAEINVGEGGVIEGNGTAEWTCEITIPENSPAEFRGKYSEHYYRVQAGLDCFGNDPDSGWVRINVQ